MNYEVFENLDFSNIKKLYNLCLDNKDNLSLVKNLYARENRYLQETLNFMIDLDVLKTKENKIIIDTTDNFKHFLIENIILKPKYSLPLKNYLQNFNIGEDKILSFKPNPGYNILTSSLRNFLISADIVEHDTNNNYILVDTSQLDKIKKSEYSPQRLDIEIKKQKELGLAAEKLVYNKEKIDLLKIDRNLKPDHVSLRDVSAGYDIKSFIKSEGEIKEIYIEVKAVPSSNYKFHLSPGEYQKAIKNLDNYFLYLLPVDNSLDEKFNYEKILKINNLQSNIFDNKTYWSHENDGFVVFKKQ
jgi:hypothetical protein